MSEINRNKRCNVLLTIVMSGLVLAALCALLATPGTALAKKPSDPGGGSEPVPKFTISMVQHEGSTFDSPTYLPECDATTSGEEWNLYWGYYERHDLRATVTTDTGYQLTDDISFEVETNRRGEIVSFQLFGQDMIGTEALMHESELVVIDPPVTPSDAGFTLHVDVDDLPIWKTNKHLKTKAAKRIEMVGTISVSDLVYTPLQ